MNISTLLLTSIASLIQHYAEEYIFLDLQRSLVEMQMQFGVPAVPSYDFVIVGGGTAGSLVAARLSQSFNVLLLESGGDPVPVASTPAFHSDLQYPSITFRFNSTPMTTLGVERGEYRMSSSGRMLGGTGSINGNIYNRGHALDYDRIARFLKDDSWKFEEVLNDFKDVENFVGTLVHEEEREEYYGTHGAFTVGTVTHSLTSVWMNAGEKLGYNKTDPGHQSEGPFQIMHFGFFTIDFVGFAPLAVSIKNGQKESTYTAFLHNANVQQGTLTISRYSHVEQVLVNSDTVAYGVRYSRHGFPQIALASKEVILCAGVFSSPALLLRSGIGPKDILERAEVAVIQDLPGVGQNLQDHIAVILPFSTTQKLPFPDPYTDDVEEFEKYHNNERQGSYTQIGSVAQGFFVSSRAKENGETEWPNIQLELRLPRTQQRDKNEISISVANNRMKSYGELEFNATAFKAGDLRDDQLLRINYYKYFDETDFDVLLDGIKLALRIVENSSAFGSLNLTYDGKIPKECETVPRQSDEYWKCFIKQTGYQWSHRVGTCKMGPPTDASTVVGSDMRVKGVDRLRIIDASVIPFNTNANTNAPTILVAEKGVKKILKQYEDGSSIEENGAACVRQSYVVSCVAVILAILLSKICLSLETLNPGYDNLK